MDELARKISQEIAHRFPEMAGIEPSISPLPNSNQQLIFKKTMVTEDGSPLSLIVKATIDSQGNLLKVTTSRG